MTYTSLAYIVHQVAGPELGCYLRHSDKPVVHSEALVQFRVPASGVLTD